LYYSTQKIKEFQSFLTDFEIKPLSFEVEETGLTFEENALLKAHHAIKLVKDHFVLTEDSGLEVTALHKKPGVHSKRYSVTGKDEDNNLKLLKELERKENREAYFKCVICLNSPSQKNTLFQGEAKGTIAKKISKGEGFGYDFCFIPHRETKTYAELGLSYKNTHSHRARALKKLSQFLKAL